MQKRMRGRVLALQAMVLLGSTPIGGPLLGVICEEFGARVGFLVGGVACFVAAAWGASVVRRATGNGGRALPTPEYSIGAATPNSSR